MHDFAALAKIALDSITSPKRMIIVWLFLGFAVFAPNSWLLGSQFFISLHRPWFVLPFVFFSAMLVGGIGEEIRTKILLHRRLQKLSSNEKKAISRFLENGGKDEVIMWPWETGVGTLLAAQILIPSAILDTDKFPTCCLPAH